MQIFSLGVNDEFSIGDEVRAKVLTIGDDFVDLELRSCDDGDTRVVTLLLPTSDAGAEAEELVAELAGMC